MGIYMRPSVAEGLIRQPKQFLVIYHTVYLIISTFYGKNLTPLLEF